MVRRIVGVGEGNAVIGDVVLAVLEAPQGRLGFIEAGPLKEMPLTLGDSSTTSE